MLGVDITILKTKEIYQKFLVGRVTGQIFRSLTPIMWVDKEISPIVKFPLELSPLARGWIHLCFHGAGDAHKVQEMVWKIDYLLLVTIYYYL